eukprot:SAG11_NODE_5083_length_1669_cov_1.604459_2_plen_93_part_00
MAADALPLSRLVTLCDRLSQVMISIENQLRYGPKGKGGFGIDPVPPFDTQSSIDPQPGSMVLFPPWLVHSVPPAPAATPNQTEEEARSAARE